MMARPVAHYLMRFGAEAVATHQAEEKADFAPMPMWPRETEQQEESAEDRLRELEAAREGGHAEGYAAAREEFATELEKQRKLHQSELAGARLQWVRDEGAALRAGLAAGLIEIEERLAQGVGRVLAHFVIDVLRKQMMTELIEAMRTIIATNEALPIKISGPENLLASLRESLAETRANVIYEVSDSIDVTVKADETTIETQLSAWVARIKAEME
jgi:hypothetical protein